MKHPVETFTLPSAELLSLVCVAVWVLISKIVASSEGERERERMGKGELWDDSALINAFDEAISNYKKMHGKGYKETSSDVAGDVKSITVDSSAAIDANQNDESLVQTVDGGNNDASNTAVEAGEVENSGTAKGNEVADLQVPEEHALGSNTLPFQDQSHQTLNHSTSLTTDDYNELYKQYYEVEEKREKILQRLQHFSSWTYADTGEASVPDLHSGPHSATQEYQPSICQVPCGKMIVSCCSCACPCFMASCSSLPCASRDAGTRSADASAAIVPQKLPEDVDFVKMAMGAAERAISSLKEKTSEWKEDNKICSGMEQSVSSETDLSIVLNSWYSAGFYTGKYLTEQSLAKKRHG